MEQAQYWMLMKRRELLKSQFQASMNSVHGSWEERAFAEDASGHLGGSIWPPRSYSCSFCKREFRSAQALGGHMNVHRRDRARLKQSLSPHHDDVFQHQNHIHSSVKSLDPEVCTLENYDLLPKYSASTAINSSASALLSPRVSSPSSTKEKFNDHTFASPPSFSCVQEQHKGSPLYNNLSRFDHSLTIRLLNDSDSKLDEKVQNQSGALAMDSTCLSHDNFVATDLFMGLSSVITRKNLSSSAGSCTNQQAISCKRPKTNVSVLSLLIKPCSDDRYMVQSEAMEPTSSSPDDIDLELRLGEPPHVKLK